MPRSFKPQAVHEQGVNLIRISSETLQKFRESRGKNASVNKRIKLAANFKRNAGNRGRSGKHRHQKNKQKFAKQNRPLEDLFNRPSNVETSVELLYLLSERYEKKKKYQQSETNDTLLSSSKKDDHSSCSNYRGIALL
ncbi:hypothetical protein DPMN_109396 [Dreissena polymorpha]|uniref:Uncharacterized protein n=1 Tax=Dreissena polymorpha TaxID=45954 RepID=A0A9D4QMW5_DREPO|nr:hypothetical protein DPMN_109396 [Dreissena polymorpha]